MLEDCQENHTGEHCDALARVVVQLLLPEMAEPNKSEQQKGKLLDLFWDEFEHFHGKT